VLCEKEVLGDYVGSPVMIPSAHADGVTKQQGAYNAATQHPSRRLQLTGVLAATYSRALVLSTRTDRHAVPLCGWPTVVAGRDGGPGRGGPTGALDLDVLDSRRLGGAWVADRGVGAEK
jgi:hypothetical protein